MIKFHNKIKTLIFTEIKMEQLVKRYVKGYFTALVEVQHALDGQMASPQHS